MTSASLFFPDVDSPFSSWYRHFLDHREGPQGLSNLPWLDSAFLTPEERRLAGPPIQQFQLGEWARGRGLRQRAATHPALADDPWFVPALELFIKEEQRHSGMLGRFLDRESIPRLHQHWVDGVFRKLRKLAGLELCVMVLVTAEVLAIPFYQALRDATRSKLLRAICRLILYDEVAHLQYQALTLSSLRRELSGVALSIRRTFHLILFHCTALILWQQHHRIFRAAGWDFQRYWRNARREFQRLQESILELMTATPRAAAGDERRLD